MPPGDRGRRDGPGRPDAAWRPDTPGWPSALDGRARSPSELLDNLRLRLSQLAENHPSAPRWPEAHGGRDARPHAHGVDRADDHPAAGREPAAGDLAAASGGAAADDGAVPADSQADADERAGVGDDEATGPLADAIRAARLVDGPLARAADGGAMGKLTLPGSWGKPEPYRPWFMSGEPGSPWWAAESDL